MKFVALNITFLLFTMPVLATTEVVPKTTCTEETDVEQIEQNQTPESIFYKAGAIALGANLILDFMSVYLHEHGHGIASGDTYTIKLTPTPLGWGGICKSNTVTLKSLLAGPLAGIISTYTQCVALKTFDGYMHNKPLQKSFYKAIKFPFTFVTKAFKTMNKIKANRDGNVVVPKQRKPLTLSTLTYKFLLALRLNSLVGETFYGLLPTYHNGHGDGERIWKIITRDKMPTFLPNASFMVAPFVPIILLAQH